MQYGKADAGTNFAAYLADLEEGTFIGMAISDEGTTCLQGTRLPDQLKKMGAEKVSALCMIAGIAPTVALALV